MVDDSGLYQSSESWTVGDPEHHHLLQAEQGADETTRLIIDKSSSSYPNDSWIGDQYKEDEPPSSCCGVYRRTMVLVALLVIVSTCFGHSPDGTFMSITDNRDDIFSLWGKKKHKKHKKKKHSEPQMDCDAILEGVFHQECIWDSGTFSGTCASVSVENGMLGISSQGDALGQLKFGAIDPDVPTPSKNCHRIATMSVAPDWSPEEQVVVKYNVASNDSDEILYFMASTYCVFSKLSGDQCEDTLDELKKDFKKEESANLDLYSAKKLC